MKQSRRKFLKLLLTGSGILILERIFGLRWLSSDSTETKKIADLGDFKIVKSGNQLNFFNQKGEKLFVLSKDGTLEI
jgi:hypothetical protein